MDKSAVILVTGAAGFIGSCTVGYLNRRGYENIIIVDDFTGDEKRPNYVDKKVIARVERDELFNWLHNPSTIGPVAIDFVFHLGARTDTTEFDYSVHEKLNVEYSKKIWNFCAEKISHSFMHRPLPPMAMANWVIGMIMSWSKV